MLVKLLSLSVVMTLLVMSSGMSVYKTNMIGGVTDLRDASYYLKKCGYIPSLEIDEPTVAAALVKFQHIFHLPITGTLDDPTLQLMKQPGCGAIAPELIPSLGGSILDIPSMTPDVTNLHVASLYLRKCGYIPSGHIDQTATILALLKFQHVLHLPVTGTLNYPTLQVLKKPGCGITDRELIHSIGSSILGTSVWQKSLVPDVTSSHDASFYLRKCGYIPLVQVDQPAVTLALMKFQQVFHLPVTGVLNEKTLQILKQPGCGATALDLIPMLGRSRLGLTFPEVNVARGITNVVDAPYYLRKCGYLMPEEINQQAVTLALVKLQHLLHLPVTGTLNDPTLEMMRQPGCGVTGRIITSLGRTPLVSPGIGVWNAGMAGAVTNLRIASVYLKKCGLISSMDIDQPQVTLAIKKFQQVVRIPVTGILDELTLGRMQQPGCGVIAHEVIPSLNTLPLGTNVWKTGITRDVTSLRIASVFLKKCGLISSVDIDPLNVVSVLRKFQQVVRLPVTGVLDEPTLGIMRKPGCGVIGQELIPSLTTPSLGMGVWKTGMIREITNLRIASIYLKKCGLISSVDIDRLQVISAIRKLQQLVRLPITGILDQPTLGIMTQLGCGVTAEEIIPPLGTSVWNTGITGDVTNLGFASIFLKKCGLISSVDIDRPQVTLTLRKFQQLVRLPVTGILDEQTVGIMKQPGCGVTAYDAIPYFNTLPLGLNVWKTGMTKYVSNLDIASVYLKKCGYLHSVDIDRPSVIVAIKTFQQVVRLPVTGILDKQTLGIMMQPRCGVTENMLIPSLSRSALGMNVFPLSVQQYRRKLALHSNFGDAMMEPVFPGYKQSWPLHQDSIEDIQTLLGQPKVVSVDACSVKKWDAVVTDAMGDTYFFAGKHYFKVSSDYKLSRTPRLIRDDWIGLPDNVDAATVLPEGQTIIFKGKNFYLFRGQQPYDHVDRTIQVLRQGFPDNVDAAFMSPRTRLICVAKGLNYFNMDGATGALDQIFPGVPTAVDAILRTPEDNLHLFLGKQYRVFDSSLGKVLPGMRSIGQDYFGCRNNPVDLPAIIDPTNVMSGIPV